MDTQAAIIDIVIIIVVIQLLSQPRDAVPNLVDTILSLLTYPLHVSLSLASVKLESVNSFIYCLQRWCSL